MGSNNDYKTAENMTKNPSPVSTDLQQGLNKVYLFSSKMWELQKLINERQELIDKLCMEIVGVEERIIKMPVEVK